MSLMHMPMLDMPALHAQVFGRAEQVIQPAQVRPAHVPPDRPLQVSMLCSHAPNCCPFQVYPPCTSRMLCCTHLCHTARPARPAAHPMGAGHLRRTLTVCAPPGAQKILQCLGVQWSRAHTDTRAGAHIFLRVHFHSVGMPVLSAAGRLAAPRYPFRTDFSGAPDRFRLGACSEARFACLHAILPP